MYEDFSKKLNCDPQLTTWVQISFQDMKDKITAALEVWKLKHLQIKWVNIFVLEFHDASLEIMSGVRVLRSSLSAPVCTYGGILRV